MFEVIKLEIMRGMSIALIRKIIRYNRMIGISKFKIATATNGTRGIWMAEDEKRFEEAKIKIYQAKVDEAIKLKKEIMEKMERG